jgi:hypothetical protein
MAFECENITGEMVEAQEFMALSQRFKVRSVPRTVVNDSKFIDGGLPEQSFLERVVELAQLND